MEAAGRNVLDCIVKGFGISHCRSETPGSSLLQPCVVQLMPEKLHEPILLLLTREHFLGFFATRLLGMRGRWGLAKVRFCPVLVLPLDQ